MTRRRLGVNGVASSKFIFDPVLVRSAVVPGVGMLGVGVPCNLLVFLFPVPCGSCKSDVPYEKFTASEQLATNSS